MYYLLVESTKFLRSLSFINSFYKVYSDIFDIKIYIYSTLMNFYMFETVFIDFLWHNCYHNELKICFLYSCLVLIALSENL